MLLKFKSRKKDHVKESLFFISHEQIETDCKKGEYLVKSKQIVEKQFPETWTVGLNPHIGYWKHLFLAIFLGFFGIDRLYLGKIISGVTKAVMICVLNPLMILAIVYLDFVKSDIIVSVVFLTIFFSGVIGFYVVDVIIAIFCPRDINFKRIVRTLKNEQ